MTLIDMPVDDWAEVKKTYTIPKVNIEWEWNSPLESFEISKSVFCESLNLRGPFKEFRKSRAWNRFGKELAEIVDKVCEEIKNGSEKD